MFQNFRRLYFSDFSNRTLIDFLFLSSIFVRAFPHYLYLHKVHCIYTHAPIIIENNETRAVLFWLFPEMVNLPPKPVSFQLTFIQ